MRKQNIKKKSVYRNDKENINTSVDFMTVIGAISYTI